MTSPAAVVARFKEASSKKPLYGHTSEATAYVVDDYPYGSKLRTKIRYWLEFAPKKGYRFVSQTLDPKKMALGVERWNAPKKSTYVEFSAAMYLDSQDHVQWEGLGQYSDEKKFAAFISDFPHADLTVVKQFIEAKIRYLKKYVAGEIGWKINGVPQPVSEAEIGDKRKELEAWEDLARKV